LKVLDNAAAKRVLVTGSSGRIGRAVSAELLRRGHHVRGFDLAPTPELTDMVVGTLTDAWAVESAMRDRDAVIHLAATPDDGDFLNDIVPNNIVGVYHIFEAARAAGVQRLILASTTQLVWYEIQKDAGTIRTDTQPTPRYWYAASKSFLEGAGRAFAEKFGMSVLAVRLGWCPRTRAQIDEIRTLAWAQDGYLSPGDAGRFFACALEAAEPTKYAVVYAASKPVRRPLYDLEPAARLLGFEPHDQWPQGADTVTS